MTPAPLDASIRKLVDVGVARRYPEGALLFAEGDPAGPVFVVVDGEVSLFVGDAASSFGTIRAGEIIGELSAIDHLPRSASAVAASAVEVRAVPAARFAELLETDPKLTLYVARAVAAKLRRSTESRTAQVRGLPVAALANAILERASTDGTVHSVAELTSDLGTSHEMVSRAIDFLVASGAITLDRGTVFVLDRSQLEEVTERANG
ncbi:MAG: hypothetical protein QOI55_249 [Actinomycetota bacterium]|nr:hypothetical protein [Actinomycetota bacterium]